MNSVANREESAKARGKYLLATRVGSISEIKEDVLARPGRFRKIAENLQAKEVSVGDGILRRRYILCFNPREAERERRHRDQVIKELDEELASHSGPSGNCQVGNRSSGFRSWICSRRVCRQIPEAFQILYRSLTVLRRR